MNKKLITGVLFFLFAMIALPLGTIQHELGHVISATLAGIPVKLSYGRVQELMVLNQKQLFQLAIGGLIATWSFSIIGLIIVVIGNKKGKWQSDKPSFGQITATILAMFCARSFLDGIFFFSTGFQGAAGDERMIFDYLQISIIPIVFLELLIAVGITITVYRIIPKGFRLVSGVGTIIGLFSGVMLWYNLLGPILLPL